MGLSKSTLPKSNGNGNNPNYQFFDLGSGGGKLVLQSHLELPSIHRSVGIELSPTRHSVAMRRYQDLISNGDIDRIQQLAFKTWGWDYITPVIELNEGDLFELDINQATHMYLSSLCFSEDMLERVVHKIETEGSSLQIVASLRLLPLSQSGNDAGREKTIAKLGDNTWQEFIEMSWNRGGDGCPVYFYAVKQLS